MTEMDCQPPKGDEFANVMLLTANVGSIFEDPKNLLKIWIKEFLKKVDEQKPDFLAVHFQEVGGKNYEESMIHVEMFVRNILDSEELKEYDRVCILLDEDFTDFEKFTALGNIYFVHKSITDLKIFDFEKKEYVDLQGQVIHAGNIESATIKEKSKFPKNFSNSQQFPECRWSRKGYMRTRWSLQGTEFELVNIHLFHDASNLIAFKESPSPYSRKRQSALRYLLDHFISDNFDKLPCFIFGDLNFRLNIQEIVKKLTAHCEQVNSEETGKKESILYKQSDDEYYLKLGQKVFDLKDSEKTFNNLDNVKWLIEHDNELDTFKEQLFEVPKSFPPSYPFTEDLDSKYMKTRCPSWCDRILFNQRAQEVINLNSESTNYDIVGFNAPMGDHKPVLLKFKLPVQRPSSGKEEASVKSSVQTTDDPGKEQQPALDEKSALDKPQQDGSGQSGSGDSQAPNEHLDSIKENIEHLSLDGGESGSNVSTRVVCLQYGDSQKQFFRETAV